jgi:hypothetical protein
MTNKPIGAHRWRRGGRRGIPCRGREARIWIDKYLLEKGGKRREGTEKEERKISKQIPLI